ncbi:hypothetical protein BJ165DRAFT_290498 [Panaeolus papilionaceus]|nr:hypothetical protein BJ165DRAFT_290498 [Panaeolus papilionaceus]
MGRLPSGSMRAGGLTASASVPGYSSNLYHHQQGMLGGLEVDYSLSAGRAAAAVLNSRSHSPYDYDHGVSQQHLVYTMGLTPPPPPAMPLTVDPTMAGLIDSSQYTLGSANAFSSAYGLRHTGSALSMSQNLDNLHGYVSAHTGSAYTRTKYTPTLPRSTSFVRTQTLRRSNSSCRSSKPRLSFSMPREGGLRRLTSTGSARSRR